MLFKILCNCAVKDPDRSKGFIRSLLSKRLTIRRVPELKFILDTSLEYGNKIENIIKDINLHEK